MAKALPSLREIGEREAIRRLEALLSSQWRCPVLEPGDDAVCISGDYENIIVKIDGGSLSSSLAPWMDYTDLGWQWVAATASDLVAKAARPLVFLLSVGLPPELPEEALYKLVEGARDSAKAHGAWLGGGDTNSSRNDGWIDVAAVGRARSTPPGRRARPGDRVYVTLGRLGLSGIVLHALMAGSWREAAKQFPEAFSSFTRPVARLRFIDLYEALGSRCITASLDISDGLVESLYQLSEKTMHTIMLDYVPVPEPTKEYARLIGLDATSLVLYGGQEYEVLFTVRPRCLDEARQVLESLEIDAVEIGVVTQQPGQGVYINGKLLRRSGWDNFRGYTER